MQWYAYVRHVSLEEGGMESVKTCQEKRSESVRVRVGGRESLRVHLPTSRWLLPLTQKRSHCARPCCCLLRVQRPPDNTGATRLHLPLPLPLPFPFRFAVPFPFTFLDLPSHLPLPLTASCFQRPLTPLAVAPAPNTFSLRLPFRFPSPRPEASPQHGGCA